ncbi:tetratricopeptide repeat protein [Chryseobacterium rhizosphaerae]|uniref:Tetratricopeptide repeat protein n=1 Tax=Chryseobacterium rhizosphaerae TaxID=395937 RepID=A0ABX9IJM3_9FLAO|nr:tetratricopeptide repeat protein [Chryseobacterium rhizosphaerae]MDC8100660.1 tetratricopeptide repeat protein [Chryseobacterium rhizosphaerae]REC74676.1 hypothetical protein DRF57_13045 [Chryseobacterium rhizosphaerae]GEN66282.1 hypothetical protein CRH01_08500 [Chryseobacterium rhizosphaerae]
MMIRFFLFIVLIVLVSCNQRSRKQDEENFDISLGEKNEQFSLSGEYDSLVSLNTKYYRQANQMGYEEGKALTYVNLAKLNISLGNFQKSEVLFGKAKNVLENSQNNLHKAIFYTAYGRFNFELSKTDKAFENYNKALNNIYKSENSKLKDKLLFDIYIRLGVYFSLKKEYQKGLKFFQKAQKIDNTGYAECAIGDYVYYRYQDSAYKYIATAYHKTNISGKKDGIALYTNTMMGEWYFVDGQYDKAEEMLLQALEIDKKTRRVYANYTKYIYNDLRMVYEKKGDKEKAYFYLNAYTNAIDKTNIAIFTTINKDMESFIDETKKDTKRHDKNVQWVILLSLVGFSVLGIYAWRIIDILRKKKEALKVETEKLKAKADDNKQDEILELARKNDPEFFNRFKESYPEFINKLLIINPSLEASELTFCAMLKLHFTSKEIASYTLIQHRTVQQKKYRIRKRLNIPTETDIYHFFDNLV